MKEPFNVVGSELLQSGDFTILLEDPASLQLEPGSIEFRKSMQHIRIVKYFIENRQALQLTDQCIKSLISGVICNGKLEGLKYLLDVGYNIHEMYGTAMCETAERT
eukprot:UN09379